VPKVEGHEAATRTGWLWITGGHNEKSGDNGPWDETDAEYLIAVQYALATGTICSVLHQVPNQPVSAPISNMSSSNPLSCRLPADVFKF